jgi:hypothetical protein
MTIGIGVLCSTRPRPYSPRPDAIVMISDTMGSTDDSSTDQLHKMLIDDKRMLFAVCADRIERCADLWPCIQSEVDNTIETAHNKKSHGVYLEAISRAVLGHRAQRFKYDVLHTKYTLDDKTLIAPQRKIQREWERYNPNVAMIVGAFEDSGQSLLYVIQFPQGEGAWVEPYGFPGTATIGTGGYNADLWLDYRQQHLGLSVKQSIYHAYEASRMASKSPTVNEDIEMLVATREGCVYTSKKEPEVAGFPLSLKTLAEIFNERKARGTDDLGFK